MARAHNDIFSFPVLNGQYTYKTYSIVIQICCLLADLRAGSDDSVCNIVQQW